jgi:hypothetical protein
MSNSLAVRLMRSFRLEPDPWQIEVLEGNHPQLLLNCCRQAGKSTTVAILALTEVLSKPASKILIVSKTHRQSMEVFQILRDFYARLKSPLKQRLTRSELVLDNQNRIVCLPCKEETIRGYSGITLLIIDEAARVPDDLYKAARPMLVASGGRMICMSTPCGKRGFFYDCWANGGDDWHRIEIPATKVSHIDPDRLERNRRAMGESWYRQEFCCSFEALEGLVYPDFGRCVVPALPPHLLDLPGQVAPSVPMVGGIDFGFRNPFAAIWGRLDRDGILWLTGEHYSREKPLKHHIQYLPPKVTWYADPSGASDIADLCAAGLTVRAADNEIRPGIAAVRARLESGTLKILAGTCPNLLAEAGLYRYGPDTDNDRAEQPIDEYNHALGALRYMISKVDFRMMARLRGKAAPDPALPGAPTGDAAAPPPKPRQQHWTVRWSDPDLWTRIF